MIGGYGIHQQSPMTGEKTFTNLNTVALWGDIQTQGKHFKAGLFVGYTSNLGTSETIQGAMFARGTDISNVFRISPGISYEQKAIIIALECEYTSASYGNANGDGMGKATDTENVANLRSLLSVKYSF